MRDPAPQRARYTRSIFTAAAIGGSVAGLLAVGLYACNDGTTAPAGPGDNLTDNSHQDAVAVVTQDATVPPPVGAVDGGADGYVDGGSTSTGYQDVTSPQAACSSCTCDNRIAFCLENGTANKVTGAAASGEGGACAYAPSNQLQVGCNILPPACAAAPTCQCILDNVQPPLGCYPECSTSLGYIDVFCPHP
jgi:hypothetical protein